jgi:hypothetical protein
LRKISGNRNRIGITQRAAPSNTAKRKAGLHFERSSAPSLRRSVENSAPLLGASFLAQPMRRSPAVLDLIFIAATIAFFAISLAYVQGCRRL